MSQAIQAPEDSTASVGPRIRQLRMERNVTLREMARQLSVTPSFVSQLETGKSRASVATLYSICEFLGVSMDEVFQTAQVVHQDESVQASAAINEGPVVRANSRPTIHLDSGVTWERLTAVHDNAVDFMRIIYDVGGSSTADNAFLRHLGTEYHFVISGRLQVQLGFETYELVAGDAISFDSSEPHCLVNIGDSPVVCITSVIRQRG